MTVEPATGDNRTALLIVGAGGHAREVLALIRDGGTRGFTARVMGSVDDGSPDPHILERIGLQHLGGTSNLAEWAGAHFTVGIGSGQVRLMLADSARHAGLSALELISNLAHVGPDVRCGAGCVIFPMATVTTNIELGDQVHIGRGAAVGHDSVLSEGVTVMPNASVSGNVTIGARSTIGTGAAVIQGVTIGADVTVGAGAVVIRDVPDGVTVAGVPAKVISQR